ncbi:Gag-Pol polyprotein [Smittium culicis]|uniref:Gag-Pol polyprotein n=1 Tax=Smittium culicis TaxID=133412 RepID=A0A1R1YS96_9FUNG|nr:Gag-Pol polyprotein [Smittium culicis]
MGNKWILLAINHQTNWIVASATTDAKAETVAKFLYEKIFLQFGSPAEIISDRGPQFTSELLKENLKLQKIKHSLTTAYHPISNGKTDRDNWIIGSTLTKLAYNHKSKWDLFLDQAIWATRVRKHSVTKISPYYLVYGIDPILPGDKITPPYQGENNEPFDCYRDTSIRINNVIRARNSARIDQACCSRKNEKILRQKLQRIQISNQQLGDPKE